MLLLSLDIAVWGDKSPPKAKMALVRNLPVKAWSYTKEGYNLHAVRKSSQEFYIFGDETKPVNYIQASGTEGS